MKSMKFLSLSLLVVAFGSSVFASSPRIDQPEGELPSGNINPVSKLNLPGQTKPSDLLREEASYASQALSAVTNLTPTKIGIGLSLAALTTGVILYKKNAQVKAYADLACAITKSKLPVRNRKNAIIAAGSVTTLAGLVATYRYGLISKAVNTVSSYFGKDNAEQI